MNERMQHPAEPVRERVARVIRDILPDYLWRQPGKHVDHEPDNDELSRREYAHELSKELGRRD